MNNSFGSGTKSPEKSLKKNEIIRAKIIGKSSERKLKEASNSVSTSGTPKMHSLGELSNRNDWNGTQGSQTPDKDLHELWTNEKAELTDTLNQIKKLNNTLMIENEKLQEKLRHKEDIEKMIMDQIYELKGKYEELLQVTEKKDIEIKDLRESLSQKNAEIENSQKQLNLQEKQETIKYSIRVENSSIENKKSVNFNSTLNLTNELSKRSISPLSNSQKRINIRGQQELIMPFLKNAENRWTSSLRGEESPQKLDRSISPQRKKINCMIDEALREKFISRIKPKLESSPTT